MKVIKFRYNGYKTTFPNVLLLGLCWIAGFLVWTYLVNNVFGFNIDSPEGMAPYWEENLKLALAVAILPPLLWMILSAFPVNKLARVLMERQGQIEIFKDHAMLHYGRKRIPIDRETKITYETVSLIGRGYRRNRFQPIIYAYKIHQGGKTYRITESFRELYNASSFTEKYNGIRVPSSFCDAMKNIPFLTLAYDTEIMVNVDGEPLQIDIGEVPITMRETMPDVFDSSPYYVEYSHPDCVEGVPLVTCFVRERGNPVHVVGEIGFPDDPDHNSELTETYLRSLPIVGALSLDEEIELDE